MNSLLGPASKALGATPIVPTASQTFQQVPASSTEVVGSSGSNISGVPLRREVDLSVAMGVCHIDIAPREKECYEKCTQTEGFEFDNSGAEGYTSFDGLSMSPSKLGSVAGSHRRMRLSMGNANEQMSHRPSIPSPRASLTSTADSGTGGMLDDISSHHTSPRPVQKMSAEEKEAWNNGGKEAVMNSEGFASFVSSSSRLIERAITQASSFDILMNITSSGHEGSKRHSNMLTDVSSFECEFLRGRPVLDIQCSPHVDTQADLFLVAYGSVGQALLGVDGKPYAPNQDNLEEAAGLVCVWHSAVVSSPEKKLIAPSPVLAARFHTEDQNLVLGSCHNGQILLWDLRVNSSVPVQRSNLAGKGHKHPVYSMTMSSSSASYELITVSTDGYLCHWDVQRLSEPISSVMLQLPQSVSLESTVAASGVFNSLSVTTTVLGHSETSKEAIFGSENGNLYRVSLPYRSTDSMSQVDAHQGLVSSMHRNPHNGKFFKDLLLTSSLDWTVKLWNTSPSLFTNEPLLEIVAPSYDYVCDVQWSPANASLFSTITSGGVLSLWDLSKSTLEVQDSFNVLKDSPISSSGGANNDVKSSSSSSNIDGGLNALNRLVWANDGLSLYVGDTRGNVRQIDVKESAAKPRPGDEGRTQIHLMTRKVIANDGETPLSTIVPSTSGIEGIGGDDEMKM